jgi:hypothetical protein
MQSIRRFVMLQRSLGGSLGLYVEMKVRLFWCIASGVGLPYVIISCSNILWGNIAEFQPMWRRSQWGQPCKHRQHKHQGRQSRHGIHWCWFHNSSCQGYVPLRWSEFLRKSMEAKLLECRQLVSENALEIRALLAGGYVPVKACCVDQCIHCRCEDSAGPSVYSWLWTWDFLEGLSKMSSKGM